MDRDEYASDAKALGLKAVVEPPATASSGILRSTAIVGATNVLTTVVRLLRTKIFAIYLGPTGIGLLGFYTALMSTVTAISEVGIGNSGVRQVAEAQADPHRMAGLLSALRALTIVLALVGTVAVILLSNSLSHWTFGSDAYATGIAIISLGVFFQIIADSQMAVLNGLRRIGDLARANVGGSIIGTVLAVGVVWLMGDQALPFAVVAPVVGMLICSSWMVKQVGLTIRKTSAGEMKTEVAALFRLGFPFMLTGFAMNGALLATRFIFVEQLGLVAAGLYQAAWAIAVINVDFILNAMGIDFYPRLTSCIGKKRAEGNLLVNEQTEVALLLGAPLIIGMITFAGPLISLLFSGQFESATYLLRWLVLGTIIKIVCWPIGYLMMAHGWSTVYLMAELVWCIIYTGLVYVACPYFGVDGAGYAFVAAHLTYAVLAGTIVHLRGGFSWTRRNVCLAATLFSAAAVVMSIVSSFAALGYAVGGVATVVFALFSLKRLSDLSGNPTAMKVASKMAYLDHIRRRLRSKW